MDIRIICVGKIKEKFIKQALAEYVKRLSRYAKVEIIEVNDEKAPETLSKAEEESVKRKEANKIFKHFRSDAFKIVLALEGQSLNSEEFASRINQLAISSHSRIDFVIGGSLGLHKDLIKQADLLLSFSSFTFPHQLMRLILLEQIYRAFRIIKGQPYHK